MIFDHVAVILLTDYGNMYEAFRIVGRISFPIFCFVLVEGYFHTKNRMSYATRLGIFALISEVPYDMMYGSFFNLEKQNVMFILDVYKRQTISKVNYLDCYNRKN